VEIKEFKAKARKRENTKAVKIISASLRLGVSALIFPALAAAQCAMCKTTAEASGEAQGLNLGILFLLAPPLAIFCAIFWTAYKSQTLSRPDNHD
jgi:hypothetical protein